MADAKTVRKLTPIEKIDYSWVFEIPGRSNPRVLYLVPHRGLKLVEGIYQVPIQPVVGGEEEWVPFGTEVLAYTPEVKKVRSRKGVV